MFKQIHSIIFALVIASSCNVDEVITDSTPNPTEPQQPTQSEPLPSLAIPYVHVQGADKPITMFLGDTITFVGEVSETGLETQVAWNLNKIWVSNTLTYKFIPKSAGDYNIEFCAKNIDGADTARLIVTVTIPKEMYKREKNELSSPYWNRVYEYTPAPGQFINETKTGGFTGNEIGAIDAIQYAEQRLSENKFVSLGGFGGYIVVGFDHSIDNIEGYDFAINGNSFGGSSEPGIVWVMQDENGDGMPNDTWIELKGSESGKEETIQNYSVTYFKPTEPGQPVMWQDNLGNEGQIDYLKQYHSQDYYYPAWIDSDSYTLTGTRLESSAYDKSGNGTYWVLPEYDWGYVDNFSPIDRLTNSENPDADPSANHFDIQNAVDRNGKEIKLEYIDFIKVQCGVNNKCGWIGENSTEVFGFSDYSLIPNS